jgi:pimeloyl-ACP methyl ester carboxylesterase
MLIIFLVVAPALIADAAGDHQVVAVSSVNQGDLVRTEYVIRVGDHPLDKFKMIRLARDVPAAQLKESVLLLPHFSGTFSFWEVGDHGKGVESSFAGYFAKRGYDVYGLSLRVDGLPAGTCEAGILPCSVMAGWDIQSIVEDIAFVRSQIELLHPNTGIILGGQALGGILGIATVNAYPQDYDGLFGWSSMLYSEDPDVVSLNHGYCFDMEAQIAGGLHYIGIAGTVIQAVATRARVNPDGINANPLFPGFLTNHQALVALYSLPGPPGPTSLPVPGMIISAGSVEEDRFFYTSEERAFEVTLRFNTYVPASVVRDICCSVGGLDDQHVDNLGSFTGAVFLIGAEFGFGPFLEDQVDKFVSADTTMVFEDDLGHGDMYLSSNHQQYLEWPIHQWARRIFN